MSHQYIAKTFQGLEEILAEELRTLGAAEIKILKRAVSFRGDRKLLYRANLELRTALRILWPIAQFRARHESGLYAKIKKIDWSEYLTEKGSLAVDGITHSRFFRHSKYVALKTKDAVVDQFRERTGRRPNVNLVVPDVRINVHINEDQCTVALDSSNDSLHRRAYRKETLDAPINEVLAAGMLMLSGWRGECPFIDPMCGSGTLLIEAAFLARRMPPQWLRRDFGFLRWPDFDAALWQQVRDEAESRFVDCEFPILGFDKDFKAVRVAERNMMSAELEEMVKIERRPFERLSLELENGLLMFNPPYDERLRSDDIGGLYEMIGDRLKSDFPGFEAWMISSNFEAMKRIGLRPSRKIKLFNGALECRLLKFELYAGSRKNR